MSNSQILSQPKPLSVNEQAKLEQLEVVIVENFTAFIKVGQALAEIRDRQLYREKCETFEQYAKNVFDIARRTAYQYIAAAEVVENVRHGAQIEMLPNNERQTRELARLPKEQQSKVWEMVVKEAVDGRITASMVKNKVKTILGEETTSKIKKTREKAAAEKGVSEEFRAAFDSIVIQIQAARDSNYKTNSRKTILQHLDAIRAIVAEDGAKIGESVFSGAGSDSNKLERAGFKIFRMEKGRNIIKERAGGSWIKHSGPFPTITAMEAAFVDLMKNQKHIQG